MKKIRIILSLVLSALICLFLGAAFGKEAMFVIAAFAFAGSLAVSYGMPMDGMAYTLCGQISAAVAPDCNNPMTPGLDQVVYLANLADVNLTTNGAGITYGATPTLITAWVMTVPKFWKYSGIKTSNSRKDGLAKGKYMTTFDHELSMNIFIADYATKVQLEALANGLVVAIIKNNYHGAAGSGTWEVLGLSNGLEMSTLVRDSNNQDTKGGYSITLKTPTGLSEPHLPASLYLTSEAVSDAIVAALSN